MEYSKYDKPVQYTEDFLKKIAEKYHKCKLVGEKHFSKKIGTVHSIEYKENGLTGIIQTNNEITNKSYSPLFESTLVDKGDYFLAVDGKLKEISLTSNPRQPMNHDYFLNNENGDKMSEKNNNNSNIEDVLSKNVQELNKKNAMLENKLKVAEEKIEKYDELVKENDELKRTVEEQKGKLEESQPIVEKYNKHMEKTKEDLLEKISSGNEEVKNKYKHMSLEDLKTINETLENNLMTHDKNPRGISSEEAIGLNNPPRQEESKDPNKLLKEVGDFFQETRGMDNPYVKNEGD